MSQRGQLLVVALHALLGVAVLSAATVLSALHDPISPELATLFGAIIGLAGGGAAAISTLGSAINGKASVPPAFLNDLTSALTSAVDHLAGSRSALESERLAQASTLAARFPPVR